ncbi:MAG TPA: hypothetical protein VLK27_01290 [Chthoniobacterales bacterium]|nr:hypothetical protein [Chthoniobacterales bacterium]
MASPAWRFAFIGTALLSVGSAYAQTNPAVETSRLFERQAPPTSGMVTPDGMALPEGENASSEDESFGAQQILKAQQKTPDFTLGGSVSSFYTNNVALTQSHTISDSFLVGAAFFNWTPRINPELQFQFGAAASIFRYWDTTPLDFENIGTGVGLLWTPQNFWGIGILGRYDFTELLDSASNEILQDHEFSVALQKLLVLGRSHALTFGVIGSAGISDPSSEQRDQVGFAVGYHLQITRQFGSDLGYRLSGYFYNKGGRDDLNQVFSLALHYYITPWASVDSFLTGAVNSSNRSAFRYDVISTGGGAGLTVRF